MNVYTTDVNPTFTTFIFYFISFHMRTKKVRLHDDYKTSDEDYKNSNEDYETYDEDYKTSHDNYKTSHDNYKTSQDDYKTSDEDYKTSYEDCETSHEDYKTSHVGKYNRESTDANFDSNLVVEGMVLELQSLSSLLKIF